MSFQDSLAPRGAEDIASPGQVLLFQSAGRVCALPLTAVREIVPMALLGSPPGMPALLAGVLNLRGMAVPVVPLDRLFGMAERSPSLYTPLVILRSEPAIGLLVDSVDKIASPPSSAYLPFRPGNVAGATPVFNECASAEVEVNGLLAYLLAPEKLLLEQERRSLAEFQAFARQRLSQAEAGSE